MPYPQTLLGLQDVVLAKLRLQDTATNRALVTDWVNQAYAQAAVETQFFQRAGTATLTAGSGSYLMPDEVIEVKEIIVRGVGDDGFGVPLAPMEVDTLLRYRQGNSGRNAVTGPIVAYALVGHNQLELYPTPGSADLIQMYYTYLPDELTANGDIPGFPEPWASKILEYGALAQAAEMQADPLGPAWTGQFQDWKQRLRVHMNRRGGVAEQFPIPLGSPVAHDRSADVVV